MRGSTDLGSQNTRASLFTSPIAPAVPGTEETQRNQASCPAFPSRPEARVDTGRWLAAGQAGLWLMHGARPCLCSGLSSGSVSLAMARQAREGGRARLENARHQMEGKVALEMVRLKRASPL